MTTRQSGANRRLSLLRSALRLFSEQGYDGTTTRAIAEDAGVTEALLFKHFRTKQELLGAVVEAFGPGRIFGPLPARVHALPAREALELFVMTYLDAFWNNRVFLRMVFSTPKRDRHVYRNLDDEFGRQHLYLLTLLKELEDRDEARPGVAEKATDIISTATSGFLVRIFGDEPPDWDAARTVFVTNLLDILFAGIARP